MTFPFHTMLGLPFWLVIATVVAMLLDRRFSGAAQALVACMLAGLLIARQGVVRWPRPTRVIILLMVLLVGWLAMVTAIVGATSVAWWRCGEWFLAWVVAASMAAAVSDRALSLIVLGCVAATAAMVSVVLSWWFGDWSIGFGNPNYLLSATVPATLGALWMLLASSDARRKAATTEIVLLVVGAACIVWFSWIHQRRMPVLAMVVGVVFAGLMLVGRRSWRMAVLLAVLVAGMLLIVVAGQWRQPVRDVRMERVQFWRAAVDQIVERPFGWGAMGTLRVGEASGEDARHLATGGHIDRHAHIELLDVGVAGGIPAMLLLMVGAILLLHGLRRRDGESASAGPALACTAGAWFACCSVDNAQAELPILLVGAVLAGVMMGGGREPVLGRPAALWRLLRWPAVLVAVLFAIMQIPAATLGWGSSMEAQRRAQRTSLASDQSIKLYDGLVEIARSRHDGAAVRELTEEFVQRAGWVGNARVNLLSVWTVADDRQRLLDLSLAVIHHNPLHAIGYLGAGVAIDGDAASRDRLPSRLRQRIDVWRQGRAMVLPSRVQDIEDAADAVASIAADLRARRPMPAGLSTALWDLVDRYGDLTDVGVLVVEAISTWGQGAAPWAVERAAELRWAWLRRPGALTAVLIPVLGNASACRALWPMLAASFPLVATSFDQGSNRSDAGVDPPLRQCLLAVWRFGRGRPGG